MKKLFLMAVMAMITLAANAQQGHYFITPHAGFGYTHMSNYGDESNGYGLSLGVDYEYMTSDNVGLSAGVDFLYSHSNSAKLSGGFNSTLPSAPTDFWTTLSNLNFPLLVQYHTGKFALKTGLQPSVLTSTKMHDNSGTATSRMDLMNKVGLSIPVGISYQFLSELVLDLRYALPLTKQFKDIIAGGNNNIKFTTVMLTLGYKF